MKMKKVVAQMFGIVAAMLLSSAAWSHSEEAHEEAIDYSDVEQHPFGKASDPKKATRTIEVDMHDTMRFTPAELTVKKGDTVRFSIRNSGQQLHEMVLGTEASLKEHAELMLKFPGMEHSEPYMAHVAVGSTGEIGWEFTSAGEFSYGCLVPGHYDAGMKGRIVVQ